MQKLISVNNPDFTVPPVTTQAQTIISRRWVKIPINSPGTYGHLKNTTYPYTVYTDIGDNENIVDLTNTHVEFDFTGVWVDPAVDAAAQNATQLSRTALTPNFDQSVQALVNRLRIGTSQGMEIEQIQAYNKLSNIIQAYSMSSTAKQFHLTNQSSFSKSVYDNRGQSELSGDGIYTPTPSGGPANGVAKRIELRLTHSSFFQRVRMLPLFLFRNGMRIEFDFEDVIRAFTYETNATNSFSGRTLIHQVALNSAFGGNAGVNAGTRVLNWFVGCGNYAANGTINVASTIANAANSYNARGGAGLGVPVNYFLPAGIANDASIIPAASIFYRIKNFLYLDAAQFFYKITLPAMNCISGTTAFNLSATEKLMIGIPVQIYEKGELKWRGFTAIPFSYASNNFQYPAPAVINAGAGGIYLPQTGNCLAIATATNYTGTTFEPTGVAANNLASTVQGFQYAPLYSWDHAHNSPNEIPYKMFGQVAADIVPPEQVTYLANCHLLDADLQIDSDNAFVFQTLTNGGAANATLNPRASPMSLKDPRILDMNAIVVLGQKLIKWNYTVNNIEWRMSLIKPSSDVFTQYTTAFQKDIGIPYPFTRIFQFTRVLNGPVTGQQQIQIPISVRSLNSVLVVLGDQTFLSYDSNNPQRFFVPMLSTFQRRGLSRIELVTGGTVKPEYRIQLDPKVGMEHIPLLENFFGVDGMTSFNPSFSKNGLGLNRNLLTTGNLSTTAATQYAAFQNNSNPLTSYSGVPASIQSLSYTDSSRFVWGINLAKKDTQGFASGLDTSMSGSVILNLYFAQDAAPTGSGETFDSGAALSRNVVAEVYCFADALFTAQNDANLVRW